MTSYQYDNIPGHDTRNKDNAENSLNPFISTSTNDAIIENNDDILQTTTIIIKISITIIIP
jgi:hypothetical protein